MAVARSKKVSRWVSSVAPQRASWTIPMTGLLHCAESTSLGTAERVLTSATLCKDCGMCAFISSPSAGQMRFTEDISNGKVDTYLPKSALYGVVTERFNRKVECEIGRAS